MIRALSHRPFAWLWTGQAISRLGDSLYRIALLWWVKEKTGSAAIMGSVYVFALVPTLIFLLIGGVTADRLPRLRVMLSSDVLRGVLIGGVAFLAATNQLAVWHIYVASLIFGFVDAFFQPAYFAIMPELIPTELRPNANALTNLSGQFAGIIGPALGALIVKLGGTSITFALDGVSFFAAAFCVLPILGVLPPRTRQGDAPPPNAIHDLREGFAAIFASPWLWITIALFALVNVTESGPISVTLPFLVGSHVDWLGLLYALSSIGAVLGTVWMGRATKLRRRGLWAYGAVVVDGLMLVILGLPVSIVGWAVAALIHGITLSIFSLIWTNVLQELVPANLLGRVSSVDQLGSFVMLPLGYGLTGVLTDQIGPSSVFILGGLATVILMLIGLAQPAIRNLD